MIGDYHKHLDACAQCREQPFNLCVIGARRLRAEVGELANDGPPSPAPAKLKPRRAAR